MNAWIILLVAGLLEIVWAAGLKTTHGFTRPGPSALVIVALVGSTYLLAVAARSLPIGTAYAVWTGIGAAGTAIAGMALFGESVTAWRLGCIALIVAGVLGLRWGSS